MSKTNNSRKYPGEFRRKEAITHNAEWAKLSPTAQLAQLDRVLVKERVPLGSELV